MKFAIFHGSFGSPEGNWTPDLKQRLVALSQEVITPAFPCEDWNAITAEGPNAQAKHQNLENWLTVFEKEVLTQIAPDDKLCFVGHSIAPLFILHAVSKFNIQLDSAIFASPFLEDLGGEYWQFRTVNGSFYKTDFDWEQLRKLVPTSYVLYSDNDPYVDEHFPIDFGTKMRSSMILVRGGGHLNLEAQFKKFPLLFELCVSRIDRGLILDKVEKNS